MTTSNARGGLLALTVAFSAGSHAALVPEHLGEMPPLGYLFIFAAAIGGAIALALVVRPTDARIPRLAVLFLTTQVVVWAMFIVLQIPGFTGTPEPVEPIALVCKAVELLGIALALPLVVGPPRSGALSGSATPEFFAPGTAAGSSSRWPRRRHHAHVHLSGPPVDAGEAGRQVGTS